MDKMKGIAAALCLLALRIPAFAAAQDRFAAFEGGKVHYRAVGAGKDALVFVHGWTCSSKSWRFQENAFPDRRVIIVDLPGHGESSAPKANYSLAFFARSLDAVLSDAGVERAVLIGHSMGAPIVGRFARDYPKKTLGLVLVDGAMRPFLPDAEMRKTVASLRADYKTAAPAMIDSWLTAVKDGVLRAELRATMVAAPEHVGVSAFEGMADSAAYAKGPLRVPVLAVLAKSHGWTDADLGFLRALAPKIRIAQWNGVSHFLMLERPREFNELVRGFLTEINFEKEKR
jgi:pimeloyl-ACP methyl ester carboxylesterase